MFSPRRITALLTLLALAFGARPTAAAPRGADMDYGPSLNYTVLFSNVPVTKAVTVKVASGTNTGAIAFDTETLQYSAGWLGWLDLSKTHLTSYKGELAPRAKGAVVFEHSPGPGWARRGDSADPRPNGIGVLPRDWARYEGMFRHGSNVVFAYNVGGARVLDLPGMDAAGELIAFTRTLELGPTTEPLALALGDWLAEVRVMTQSANAGVQCVHRPASDGVVAVGLSGAPGAARFAVKNERLVLHLPPLPTPARFKISFLNAPASRGWESRVMSFLRTNAPAHSLAALCQGGPAWWPERITAPGKRGDDAAAFAIDSLPVPEKNPWNSWMRLTAFDFFSDGRAAVTTWNGDVWIVSGIDDELSNVTWKRFAAGLFDPLGLKVLRDELYVLERHQITRLRDLNGDGEADAFDNINNEAGVSPSYHAFAMDLQADSAGNFFFTRAGQRVETIYPLNGGMVRVSADGTRAELIAHGLRAANGIGIGPRDEITAADNQGNWIPASRLNLIEPGRFYGYVPHAHGLATNTYEPPLCWIPVAVDNSAGGQVWVTSAQWPTALSNHLLHTSYGAAALFHVLWESIDGVPQGGVFKLPLKFDSGIQRARFHPRDGQLYVAGLKGWQTKGVKDGALQRVRFTGKPLHMPTGLHVRADTIELTFSEPLDRATAEDLGNWNLQQWNYRWTEKYGSDEFSVAEPARKGRDTVAVKAAKLSPDGRRVALAIPGLKPVMQMRIQFALKAGDGAPVEGEIFHTINIVPGPGR